MYLFAKILLCVFTAQMVVASSMHHDQEKTFTRTRLIFVALESNRGEPKTFGKRPVSRPKGKKLRKVGLGAAIEMPAR